MSRLLRDRLNTLLRTDSDLDAFCLDEFPALYHRFSRGMERVEKVTLLLSIVESDEVSTRLSERFPDLPESQTTSRSQTSVDSVDRQSIVPSAASWHHGAILEELSLNHLKRTCARLVTDLAEGTAYLVHASYLVTCASLVTDLGVGGMVEAHFLDLPQPVRARVRQINLSQDWAILELAAPISDRLPLPSLATANQETRWVAFGFPRAAGQDGLTLAGEVRNLGTIPQSDIEAVHLACDEAAAGHYALHQGASGSPVMSRGHVIGHLRGATPERADGADAGLIFACPSSAYADALPRAEPSLALGARTPATNYDPLWYSSRPEFELRALNKLRDPGVPLTVQAPEGYGKRWFVEHVLDRVRQQDLTVGRRTYIARFNIRKDTEGPLNFLDALLLPLMRQLLTSLNAEDAENILGQLSRSAGGAALRFCEGLEEHVLPLLQGSDRLLILIEEGDYLHASPTETDFFALLRALAEERSLPFKRLRLIVTIAAEAGLLETTNHSWFFGLSPPIVLEGLTYKHLQLQAALYGLSLGDPGLEQLFRLTGGHPYLSRLAMYEAATSEMTLAQLLNSRGNRGGVFSASLQHLHVQLDAQGLMPDVCQILKNPRHRLPFARYIKLYRKGVIFEATPGEYHPRCRLFEDYFGALCQ